LLCCLTVSVAPAQEAPEITSREAPATFSSKVNLVSVPVVVRDNKGRAVGGLRQEDFRLFDKGKLQVIARFSVQQNNSASPAPAITTGTPGAPSPPSPPNPSLLPEQYVAYIFDDIHLKFEQIAQIRAAAEKHFAEKLDPKSRAAIFTTSGRINLDFTDDRAKLHETLLRINVGPSAMPTSPKESDLARMDVCPPNISVYTADRALDTGEPESIRAAEAAAVACYGPDTNPPALGLMASQQILSAASLNTGDSFNSLAALIKRLSAMPGKRIIVLISPGFLVTHDLFHAQTSLIDSAIRSNVTLSSLDARGLYTDPSSAARANGDALHELADGTGGKYFGNDNGFTDGLAQLAAAPEYTYLLAFSPQNLKYDGSYHGLKISLLNAKKLDIQARRGYWAPTRAADAAEQAKEEIREAVFSLDEIHEIPVDVTTDFFKLSEASAELTVASHLDLHGLHFRTAGDRSQDTLTVITGMFDQDGRYVKGTQRIIDLRLREQTLDKLLDSGMNVKETFDIPPGRYVVRVVVRDGEGQAMAARNGTVNIQ
jgi:VWFA-related protein